MMTKGMKTEAKTREVEDKATNINCSKCGDVVGVVAAGYSVVMGNDSNARKIVGLCKCGTRMVYSIVRG